MWVKNKRSIRKRGWVGRVEKIWDDMGIREQLHLYSGSERQDFLKEEAMANIYLSGKNNLEREEAIRGNGKNKLRTYRIFKSNFFTENYLLIKSPRLSSAMAKFRCGIAPINIEIGRNYGISANERFCHFCSDEVEDEIHELLYCSMYNCVRDQLFKHAV